MIMISFLSPMDGTGCSLKWQIKSLYLSAYGGFLLCEKLWHRFFVFLDMVYRWRYFQVWSDEASKNGKIAL